MDMSGEYRIPATRETVWQALNDPEILKQAIPGCEELNKTSDNEMSAKVTAKVGPVKAKFAGDVRLENINAPESYSIVGEGKGGAAGFAKGGADVHLTDDAGETILKYTAKAEVGGKLAQIGSRLIQGTSKKMADQFFGKFSEIVGAMPAASTVSDAAPAPAVDETAPAAADPSAVETPADPPPAAEAIAEKAAEAPVAPEPVQTPSPTANDESEGSGNKTMLIAGAIVVVLLLLFFIL